jgi:hypothetical protein
VTAPKAEAPMWAIPPHPLGDVARVLPQRVERVAPAVGEIAHIAAPSLAQHVWQVVAEAAHRAADRLHDHQQDGTRDNKGPHDERPWRTASGSSGTAAP